MLSTQFWTEPQKEVGEIAPTNQEKQPRVPHIHSFELSRDWGVLPSKLLLFWALISSAQFRCTTQGIKSLEHYFYTYYAHSEIIRLLLS